MWNCLENKKYTMYQLSSMYIYLLPNITTMSKVKVCSMVVRLLPDPKDPVVGEGDIEIVAPALSEGRREEGREGGRKEGRREEGREGGRKEGRREEERKGGKEGERKEGGEGGRKGRREEEREGRRKGGGREGKKEGRREREKREGKEKKADDIMLNYLVGAFLLCFSFVDFFPLSGLGGFLRIWTTAQGR